MWGRCCSRRTDAASTSVALHDQMMHPEQRKSASTRGRAHISPRLSRGIRHGWYCNPLPTSLQAGVDTTVIALWLGHAGVRSTDAYVHADMTIKEKALALTTPVTAKPGRYRPTDKTLAFLDSL